MSAPIGMASICSLTNDEMKHRILNVYADFVSDVEPDRLCDWLVQEHVITMDQVLRIRHNNPVASDRCRALLDHLFSIRHPRAFLVVRQALSKESHYLLEYIDNQESGTSIHLQHEKQPVIQAKIEELENELAQCRTVNTQLRVIEEGQRQRVHQLEAELLSEKLQMQQLEDYSEHQKRLWEAEKVCLLQRQKELEAKLHTDLTKSQQLDGDYEDEESKWDAEQERLLKIPRELEFNVDLGRLRNVFESIPVLFQKIVPQSEKKDISICGMAIIDSELFLLNDESSKVEVYDVLKLSFNHRWSLKELINPNDMVSCRRNKCLYIIDNKVRDQSKEILRVDPNGKLIKRWSTGNDIGWGLSVTYESNIIFAALNKHKLNEYSPDGQLMREIMLLPDAGIHHPYHAIKLSNGHFVICHGFDSDELHRVCLVDADGKLKKSFGGRCGSDIRQMNVPVNLSVDGNGFVMVTDYGNHRVLLLDPDLRFKKEILSIKERHGLRHPHRIILDESNDQLFVADSGWDSERKVFEDGQIFIFDFK